MAVDFYGCVAAASRLPPFHLLRTWLFPVFVVRSLAGIETIPFVSSQVVAGC